MFHPFMSLEPELERKNYRMFRKYLIKRGFLILQESVYCKIAQNSTIAGAISGRKPDKGIVENSILLYNKFIIN